MNQKLTHPSQNPLPQQYNPIALGLGFGYSYFGARYYDPELSVWLSVDPLADEYPSTSPFMYVRGMPIILTDPNGMNDDEWDVNFKTGEKTWVSSKGGSETQYYNVKDGDGNLMSTVSTPGNYSSIYSNSTSSSNGSSTTYLSIYGSNGTDNAYHSFSNTQSGSGSNGSGSSPEWLNITGKSFACAGYYNLGLLGATSLTQAQTLDRIKLLNQRWGQISPTLKADYKMLGKLAGGLKGLGTGISYLSFGVSAAQFSLTSDPGKKFEYGFDTGMSAVGLFPLTMPVSMLYFATKPLNKLNVPYFNRATSGFSEFGMGMHSINYMPIK
jgi:RHS repeat-associated protein